MEKNVYFCSRKMVRYALIGRKLGHSWSQQWFEARFRQSGHADRSYGLHEMDSLDDLRRWVEREGIAGFNVTVPYKQAILPLLDGVDAHAHAIGAVNCVSVEQGRLVGHNTDAPAFLETIQQSAFDIQHAVILGTGGAAQAVAYALRQLGVEPLHVSRHPRGDHHLNYPDFAQRRLLPGTLLVNATPLGMYPDVDASPLPPPFAFPPSTPTSLMVYDLIYNPSPTRLLREAAAHGARTIDGLAMLKRQAELSLAIWEEKGVGSW